MKLDGHTQHRVGLEGGACMYVTPPSEPPPNAHTVVMQWNNTL